MVAAGELQRVRQAAVALLLRSAQRGCA